MGRGRPDRPSPRSVGLENWTHSEPKGTLQLVNSVWFVLVGTTIVLWPKSSRFDLIIHAPFDPFSLPLG